MTSQSSKIEKFIQPVWAAPQNVQALTTVKYDANLSAQTSILLPSPALSVKQVHGIDVVRLPVSDYRQADAVITTTPQVVCGMATADCLPILFCDQAGREVGAIHAGWRGLAAGIISASLAKLTYNLSDYLFWLGPCISEHVFEVEQDVLATFANAGWSSQIIAAAFLPLATKPTKFLGNLRYLARQTLIAQGAQASNISASDLCTLQNKELFHSYRRDKTPERMRSLIWLRD